MVILIGFNILIIVITFVASGKFAKLAVSKGCSPSRAKKYPLFLGAGVFFFNMLGQTLLMSFANLSMMLFLSSCWGGLLVLIFFVILSKAYKNMQAAPNAKSKPNPKPLEEK
jgi:hypothetical protein